MLVHFHRLLHILGLGITTPGTDEDRHTLSQGSMSTSKWIPELIQSVATSSTRDYFVCTSAFSFALGNTASDLLASLAQFARLLPQHADDISLLRGEIREGLSGTELSRLKAKVKSAWASALNNILPRFDLVVVDEAHNLKKGRESSDRNQLLAMLLGAEVETRNRVGRLLLLSATPFDRQLSHATRELAQSGKTMSACPLAAHTLKRNLEFDLVDFHVDQRGQLAVRACHPVVHFNSEELAFIATSVAAEADRLEQILLGLIGSD